MAGTTQYFGISYPTATDYVKDGAQNMQTIAEGFDSAVAIPTYNNQTGTTYTFVLTDAGKTVTSNNASAVTFTIPPQASVAWANNTTLTVRNLGAGVVTIAGGAGVTVTNTAQTVAQYGEVKLIRTASNAWTVVPASGGTSGLTLISSTTLTSQTSVTVNNCFSSSYQNYYVALTTTASGNGGMSMRLTSGGTANTSSNYFNNGLFTSDTGGPTRSYGPSQAEFFWGDTGTSGGGLQTAIISRPFTATPTLTFFNSISYNLNSYYNISGGFHNVSSSFDGFTVYMATAQMTGTLRVYGMQNS